MSLITGKTKNSTAVQIHRGLEKLKLLYENKLYVPIHIHKSTSLL